MSERYPKPPAHLSERSNKLHRAYVGKTIKSSGRIALLISGLEALDRVEQARILVQKEGLILVTGKSGVKHAHPALAIEKESRAFFLRVMKTLGLDFEPTIFDI